MVRRKDTPKKTANTEKRRRPPRTEVIVGRKTFRVTMKVLKEIMKYQKRVDMLIPKLPFARLVREFVQNMGGMDFRIQKLALRALQEAAEMYIVHFFEDSIRCSAHAKRVTLMPRDMQLVKVIRAPYEPYM